jgi:hypothetical protein
MDKTAKNVRRAMSRRVECVDVTVAYRSGPQARRIECVVVLDASRPTLFYAWRLRRSAAQRPLFS